MTDKPKYPRSEKKREYDKLRARAKREAKAAAEGRVLRASPGQGKGRKARNAEQKAKAKPAKSKDATANAIAFKKLRTGTPEYRRAMQQRYPMPEMTKQGLTRMLEQAMANTAAIPVADL